MLSENKKPKKDKNFEKITRVSNSLSLVEIDTSTHFMYYYPGKYVK